MNLDLSCDKDMSTARINPEVCPAATGNIDKAVPTDADLNTKHSRRLPQAEHTKHSETLNN